MKAFLVFTLTETSFTTTSYSWIFLVWPVNYANLVYKLLHFENVKIHKHCLYWKVFGTNIYGRFISTICCFFSYIYWSVNCMSWVSKFKKIFLTCTESEARFIFEGFNIFLYGKFVSDSPILFLFFFYLVCKLFKGLFQSLCQSVNCMSWVFESWNIPRRCHVT